MPLKRGNKFLNNTAGVIADEQRASKNYISGFICEKQILTKAARNNSMTPGDRYYWREMTGLPVLSVSIGDAAYLSALFESVRVILYAINATNFSESVIMIVV